MKKKVKEKKKKQSKKQRDKLSFFQSLPIIYYAHENMYIDFIE